jgi:hypothetical protein
MTAILPLFKVCWSFLIVELVRFVPLFKKVFKYIFYVYIAHEIGMTIRFQLNYNTGDIEIYNLLHGRSPILLDYSKYLE